MGVCLVVWYGTITITIYGLLIIIISLTRLTHKHKKEEKVTRSPAKPQNRCCAYDGNSLAESRGVTRHSRRHCRHSARHSLRDRRTESIRYTAYAPHMPYSSARDRLRIVVVRRPRMLGSLGALVICHLSLVSHSCIVLSVWVVAIIAYLYQLSNGNLHVCTHAPPPQTRILPSHFPPPRLAR